MPKRNNKGFSMVEIVITIAIFAVLMVPIVSAIISSMRNTTKAKELQYRNEYAENVMEYVKEDSIESIMNGEYLVSNGSYSVTTTEFSGTEEAASTEADGTKKTYEWNAYKVEGKVKLGTRHTEYSYALEITNEDYCKQFAQGTFIDPNNATFGVVEDLDYTKVALIDGTYANFDQTAEADLLNDKINILKEGDIDAYNQYLQQMVADSNAFSTDRGTRYTIISVQQGATVDGTPQYTVRCTLKYHDEKTSYGKVNFTDKLRNIYATYPVYATTFTGSLPNIYLMYNVCVYNKYYANDYIIFDIDKDIEEEVNMFIIETAETYSSYMSSHLESGDAQPSTDILYRKAGNTSNRDAASIYMLATSDTPLAKLNLYHNFDTTGSVTDVNKKSTNVLFNQLGIANFSALGLGSSGKPLVNRTLTGTERANIGGLSDAKQGERGLYQVKLWISEGNTVDTSKNPTLTGTKGGNES